MGGNVLRDLDDVLGGQMGLAVREVIQQVFILSIVSDGVPVLADAEGPEAVSGQGADFLVVAHGLLSFLSAGGRLCHCN